jgi:DNA invertase Pin-like site-specific DNA recombinase
MSQKAIAYVSDILLGKTGEIIDRQAQKAAILRHAVENDIEIVAWFQDEVYAEDILSRPGVQAMMACDLPCDRVLVDRVWAFSRSWKELRSFLGTLEAKGKRVESCTLLWDCVSQQARWFYRKGGPKARAMVCAVPETEASMVARPATLHFANLKRASVRA